MPGYKAHICAGVIFCLVALYAIYGFMSICPTAVQLLGCFACAVLGSIFPDIDTTSKMQRIFFLFSGSVLLLAIFFQAWLLFFNLSFITIIVMFLKHRTITHSVWFISILPIFSLFLSFLFFHEILLISILCSFFFVLGAFSHILLDFWL